MEKRNKIKTPNNWKTFLLETSKLSGEKQQLYKEEINIAFKELIDSHPSEKTFAKYANGMLLTPETLFYLAKNAHKLK